MPQVGEHGITYRGNADYDMTNNTSLILRFYKPDNVATFTGAAVLGTAAVTTADGAKFEANKFVTRVFNSGDLDVEGTWAARLEFEDTVAVLKLKSQKINFFVGK